MLLSDRLKQETSKAHQALDGLLIVKIKSIRTTEEYVMLLQSFYPYFNGVESLITISLDYRVVPDFITRRKAALILTDLYQLEGKADISFRQTPLPIITDLPAALGAMYVLEGSTLGGKIIAKIISGNLELDGRKGFNFFNAYKTDTLRRWKDFKANLDSFSCDRVVEDRIILAATDCFEKFRDWLSIWYSEQEP